MKRFSLSVVILLALASQAFAQTKPAQSPVAAQPAAVNDEELMKYATLMDSINEMSVSVRDELGEMVKSSAVMNAARYNDLNKIIADSTKLAEAKATPEEIAFVKSVAAKREEETARINTTYQSLAKDYVTPAVFNKVKKALTSDPLLKKRYDSLMVELGKDNTADEQ